MRGFFLLLRYLRDYWKYFQILITDFLGQWFFFSWFVLQVSKKQSLVKWLQRDEQYYQEISAEKLLSASCLNI